MSPNEVTLKNLELFYHQNSIQIHSKFLTNIFRFFLSIKHSWAFCFNFGFGILRLASSVKARCMVTFER